MDAHELVKVFWKEENRKELSLYAYMLMGNKDAGRIGSRSLLQNHVAQ